jgi:hypothetical protein
MRPEFELDAQLLVSLHSDRLSKPNRHDRLESARSSFKRETAYSSYRVWSTGLDTLSLSSDAGRLVSLERWSTSMMEALLVLATVIDGSAVLSTRLSLG